MTALDVYFIIIAILFCAYIYVWSRGPQDGRLWRMIRRLRKTERYWRKRALRDEAILSRVIDKKTLVLGVFLCLFLIPVVNPDMSSIPAAIGNESFMVQESPFLTAADGAESSESLTSFSEALDDDVLFWPDGVFFNDSVYVANAGSYSENQGGNTWTITQNNDGQIWAVWDNTVPYEAYAILNFTIPNPSCSNEAVRIITETAVSDYDIINWLSYNISVYNHNTDTYDLQYTNILDTGRVTRTFDLGASYFSDTIMLKVHSTDSNSGGPLISWDYSCVEYGNMTLADSDHYAESFADVSDWTTSDCSISTDGDVATITENGAGSWGRAYASFSATDYQNYYYEFRSTIESGGSIRIQGYDGAAWFDIKGTTSTNGTLEGIISSSQAATLERVAFQIIGNGKYVKPDYLRIGKSTEMGWQHDGSTTAGVTNSGDAGVTFTTSSDDDKLTLQAVRTSGSGTLYVYFYIAYDTTATSIDIERDYYPFFEVSYSATLQGGLSGFYPTIHLDGKYRAGFLAFVADGTDDIVRANTQSFTASSGSKYFGIYGNLNAEGKGFTFVMDYVKACSIANWTYSGSGVGVDDYLYVDSGVLYSHIDDGYIELDYDPALSVSDTYSVYNLTTTGTAPQFSQYVSEWSTYSDNTRGATTSGTLTDIKLKFDSTETLSALKFIEDGTAPDADIVVSPDPPDDDEQVTLSSIVFDDVEVWKVWYNAISYPSGFSDVDYEATEGQENFWSYSFSSLIAGDYCFKVIANDGANNNTITQSNRDYATTRFTVRESAIVVEEITLIGAGSDFTMMQFSARINKDCSYVIYEESENNAEAATHSGSVSSPSFNLAWDKLDTTDTNVNFTIKFTNSTLTYNYTSQYQVAQTALAIDGDESLSQDEIIYSGTSTKACTWTLYLNSVQEDTGTISAAGSFVVNWTRTESVTPASISYAIKFYTATETIWENGTYDEYSLTAFSIQTLFMDLTDPSISAIFTTSWGNATGYLYENDVQKATGAEGVPLTYTKATVAGTYSVALKMDAGGEIAWYNTTYSVSAEDTLSITALSYDSSGPNVTLFVNTNWANCTLTVYENDVQKATGSEGTLSYLKATAAGDYNVSVKVDGTADTLWANYTYTVAAESALIINTLILDKTGPNITAFITTNWLNCTITIYQDDVQKDSNSEGITLSYTRSTAAGTYDIAIKIDGGASTLWHNDSYTIAIEYSWQYIYVFDTGDPATYFPWESFDFYVNGSLIEKNEFHGRTDQGYRIAVVDKFGDTIYNATHSFDYTYRLSIAIYSFKIKCWVDGEVNVTITSSGGGVMNTWMGWGDLEPFHLYGSKTYQVKWFLDNSDKKVKGTGWHYYPALDWEGNQANPDPNWYGPVSASYLTIDDYGIGHLVGVVEDIDDGGGGGDANSTEIVEKIMQSLTPLSLGVGAGFAGTFLILYFVYVAIKNIQASTGTTVIVEQPPPKKPPKLKSRTGESRLKSGVRGREQRGRHQ